MAFGDAISAAGSILSGIASVAAVYFTWEVRNEQKNLKRKMAEFYIEKVKIRIERIMYALEKNFHQRGKIDLVIHKTPRDFSNISREGHEIAITVEDERTIEAIFRIYNDYLSECWIDPNKTTEFLTPTSLREIENVNEKSEVCYIKIKEMYEKLGTAP